MNEYKVNNRRFESSKSKITGQEILENAGLTPHEDYELLYRVNEKGFVPIQADEIVDLKTAGIEGFKAQPYEKLIIKVNNQPIEVSDCFMTPIEILISAGLNPDKNTLSEIRKGGVEVSYKDDLMHKIAITRNSCFISCEIEVQIDCISVNSKPKEWLRSEISHDEVILLAYGEISTNPNVIYTINYIKGVPNKPEGSMLKGDIISVNNKMIFNVTRTDKS